MKKKTKLFFIAVLVLALGLPLVVIGFASAIAQAPAQLNNYNSYAISERLLSTAVQVAMEMDPEYEPLTFQSGISDELKKQITNDYLSSISQDSLLLNDENLGYSAVLNDESKTKNWKDVSNPFYTLKISISSSGNESIASSGSYAPVSQLNEILDYNYYEVTTRYSMGSMALSGDDYIAASDVASVHLPENFSIEFVLYSVPAAGSTFYDYLDLETPLMTFSSIALLCLAILMGAIVLFVPWRIEKDAPLFNGVVKVKALLAWMIIIIGEIGLCAACILITYITLFGVLKDLFITYHLAGGSVLGYFLTYISWAAFILCTALSEFYVKNIFKGGFLRYIREDTVFYSIFRHMKATVQSLSLQDLTGDTFKKIVKLALLQFAVLFVILALSFLFESFGAGLLLSVIWCVLLIVWLKQWTDTIRKNYLETMRAAHLLGEGKFHDLKQQDVGLLQPVYNALLDIRPGFEKAVQEAVASQNMKTELLSNVSHDLKTPLTGIKTYVELIAQSQDLEEIQEYSQKLDGYCDRLDRLIVDLFDVSKADSGNIQLDLMDLDICELFDQIYSEHAEDWEKKGLQLVSKFPGTPVIVKTDPNRTMRIFANLLSNITKYALDKTRVFAEIQDGPEFAVITLKNISRYPLEFDTEKITERFVRGDESRHEAGSGLGLAIARSFSEIQGGKFEICTDGDLFKARVTLPKANPLPVPDKE